MSRRSDDLNTTSFAMLGMLAVRPWSTYELAKHVDRSLRPLWPRARSNLFNEPKKLVAHGLAIAADETVGRRPRSVYSITPKGRRALRQWLGTPGEGPVLEFEQMLKVFFADHGTKADALQAVAEIKAWARERNAQNVAVARSYVAGSGPFPERAAVLAVVGRFHADFADMVGAWADRAAATIGAWPDQLRRADPDWTFLEELASRDPDR
jgi:DNA-binding PadR family transcriptional regulator